MFTFAYDLLRTFARVTADFALPPECLLCRVAPAHGSGGLCKECHESVPWISARAPRCAACGRTAPVGFANGRCRECTKNPPAFSHAFSAVRYGGAGRAILLEYKFRRDEVFRPILLDYLQFAAAALPGPFTAVVPVPSHRKRERLRGFSPVRELAEELGELLHLPLRDRWVRRVRLDEPQGKMRGRGARAANVAGAFAATGLRTLRAPRSPTGARVLLMDDVYTSGSTARECARTLRKAGAVDVQVATIARGGRWYDLQDL